MTNYKRKRIMADAEIKNFDTIKTSTVVPIAGIVLQTSLNKMAVGITPNQRIGRKIMIKSVECRFTIYLDGTSKSSDIMRIIIYCDKQSNLSSTVNINDILSDKIGGVVDIHSFYNLDKQERFEICYDKTFEIEAHSGTTGSFDSHLTPVEIYLWSQDKQILFDGINTTSNNYGILAVSDEGGCKFRGKTRVRYIDY